MRQNLKKRNEGFTIIEVMIVLAIAGLIMLIVFLAVPALQRNSRNTQRKNDVANYTAAMNEWSQSHQGKLPTDADRTEVLALAKLGFYADGPTAAQFTDVAPAGTANAATVETIQVVTKAKCGSVGVAPSPIITGSAVPGSARAFVVLYAVEDSGGNPVRQCQEG